MNWPVMKSGSYPFGHLSRMLLTSGTSTVTDSTLISVASRGMVTERSNKLESHDCQRKLSMVNRPGNHMEFRIRATGASEARLMDSRISNGPDWPKSVKRLPIAGQQALPHGT
jgi:hypothetical protein